MSLVALERITEALARRPQELEELRAGGQLVAGYFCCNLPEELVLAAGLTPVRLGTGGDERLVELGGRYISHQNCPFVRQNVGVFAQDLDRRDSDRRALDGGETWTGHLDVVLAAATCPQIYRMGEVIEHFFGRKVEILGLPRNFTSPEGRDYFRAEVADLAARLETLGGVQITADRLADAVGVLAQIRESIQVLYALQVDHPSVIGWREVLDVVHAGFVLDRREYVRLLRELIDEVVAAAAEATETDDRIRLFLAGSVLPPGDTKILDLVEELGARIVGDDLCTGLRPSLQLVVGEPTIPAIADAYLDRVPCAALPHLSLDTDRRLENIATCYRESGADGLIYHSLRYCDPITFKANETKRALGKEIPFLEIHTEYASSDTEGIRTRIDAFLEMIENARSRKESTHVSRSA